MSSEKKMHGAFPKEFKVSFIPELPDAHLASREESEGAYDVMGAV